VRPSFIAADLEEKEAEEALMRRLRIREALAFDGDFAAAGFVELRA
jgi:predicted nucleic acid-binding protein